MSLRRIAGIAVAAVVVSGAGLLLSGGTSAAAPPPPTPVALEATGLSSSACPPTPLGVYGSIALKPGTTVQFTPGVVLGLGQSMTLTVLSKANTTPAPTPKTYSVPNTGVKVAFPTTQTTYDLAWHTTGIVGALAIDQKGKLVIDSDAAGCKVAVQVPTPSVSASAVPSPITSAVNGAVGGVVSNVNGALGPVNSALPTLPALPTGLPSAPPLPGVPPLPGQPGGNPPGATAPPGHDVPGTSYKPSGPTVADRTVPKGYGSGSGVGGTYVPVTGDSIVAGAQQPVSNGKAAGSASSAAPGVKNGGSPRTVELASNRPRSALGALPTLAVILAILALSGATAFYARTFLLQPAEAKAPVEH